MSKAPLFQNWLSPFAQSICLGSSLVTINQNITDGKHEAGGSPSGSLGLPEIICNKSVNKKKNSSARSRNCSLLEAGAFEVVEGWRQARHHRCTLLGFPGGDRHSAGTASSHWPHELAAAEPVVGTEAPPPWILRSSVPGCSTAESLRTAATRGYFCRSLGKTKE